MTMEDLTEYLLELHRAMHSPMNEDVIRKCLLLAYEMGLEQGRKEAHALE